LPKDENEVKMQILDYLQKIGVYCWRQNQIHVPGRKFVGKKGCGDIIGLTYQGIFFAIETKSDNGKQSKDQKEFQSSILENNGLYILANCLEDLLQYRKYFRK
jgi:hypothetical protein